MGSLDFAINQPESKEVFELAKSFLEKINADNFDASTIHDEAYKFLEGYSDLKHELRIQNQTTETQKSSVHLVQDIKSRVLGQLERVLSSPDAQLTIDNQALQTTYDQLKRLDAQIDEQIQNIKELDSFNNLSDQQLNYLAHIPVDSTDFDNLIDNFLSQHRLTATDQDKWSLRNILINIHEISEQFLDVSKNLHELFEGGHNEVNKLKAVQRQTIDLENELGLSLDIGNKFIFTDPNTGDQQILELVSKEAEFVEDQIQSLTEQLVYHQQAALSLLSDVDDPSEQLEYLINSNQATNNPDLNHLLDEITEIRNEIELQNQLKAYPNVYTSFLIQFTFIDQNGESRTLNSHEIEGYLRQFQVQEAIQDKVSLEQTINFSRYGQSLTPREVGEDGSSFPGTILQQRIGAENPTFKEFEVVAISDTHIQLEPGVQLPSTGDEDEPNPTLKETLTLAEFAKWFKINNVEEKVSLYRAREILENQPEVLKQKYPDLTPEVHTFSEQGIQIKEGEKLMARDNTTYTIQAVSEDENGDTNVTLDTGQTMTLPDFLKFCKDYEIESVSDTINVDGEDIPNPRKKKEKPAKEEVNKQGINPWQYLPRIHLFRDPLDVLGLEFMTFSDYAAIGTMLSETVSKHFERSEKERLNRVGSTLPGEIGKKFADSQTSINQERTQNEKDRISSNTIAEVTEMLAKAPDRYKARAHMDFLADSGSLDLTNTELHNRLNKLLKQHAREISDNIPAGHKLQDYQIKNGFNSFGKQGKPAAIDALNALYGSGTGESISKNNESNYESECSSWGNLIREESQKEGFKAKQEIHDLLFECGSKGKQNINPAQYQGYLDFLMMTPLLDEVEDAVFYIIAGMATKNKNGQYLLTESYLSKLKRNDLPVLDYIIRFTRKRRGRSVKLSTVAPEILSELSPNFSKKGLNGNERYDKKKMQQFLFCDILSHEKTHARVQDAFDKGTNWDKDHTPYTFPAADPGVMKNMLAIDAKTGVYCRLGNAQIHNCFEGFYQSLKAIREANQNPSTLKSLGDVSTYHSQKDSQKAIHLSKIIGSWYFLYAHSNSNITKAYGDKASSITGAFDSMKPKNKKPLDAVAEMIRPIVSHYFSDGDTDLTPYIMGDQPIPKDNKELKNLVLDFPFKLMQKVAADKDSAILSILTGK